MKKLLCIDYSGDELEQAYWGQLKDIFENVVFCNESDIEDHTDAEAVFLKLGASFTKEQVDRFPDLKYISILGTGFGGIDVAHAKSKSIAVTNVADYATQSVAEFTIGILLEHFRELSKARSEASAGNYSEAGFSAMEIASKQFGIVGLGAIGKRTSKLAQAFGAEVSYWSANSRDDSFTYKELQDLCADSDIMTINAALNDQTEGLLSADLISNFKPGAIVINPSPMELLDLDALEKRLSKDDITFIFDHADEMTEQDVNRITSFKNCIAYPPIGYITSEATAAKQQVFVDNVVSFISGGKLNRVG